MDKWQRKFSILDALKQPFYNFWSPLKNLLKASPKGLFKTLVTSGCFYVLLVLLTGHFASQGGNFRHLDVISAPA